MKIKNYLFGFIALALIGAGGANMSYAADKAPKKAVVAAPATKETGYSAKGAQTCLKCHDESPVIDILQTPHAVKGDSRTPFAGHECETCHGASAEHTQMHPEGGKRVLPTIVFKGENISSVEDRNKVCLGCHENGLRMNWQGSKHQNNDVACNSCHTVHAKKDPVLVKISQPEKCFTCHAEQRAQSFQFSHHPIREGKVVCSDCHKPHGSSAPKSLKENNINETCYNCHAEKRGPFLWEHEPVREDCSNCHTPHGSTQARLLKERPPFLCTNCHNTGGHNSSPFNANNLPGSANVAANAKAVSVRLMARGCVNCHSEIHGSNSPAGNFFNH